MWDYDYLLACSLLILLCKLHNMRKIRKIKVIKAPSNRFCLPQTCPNQKSLKHLLARFQSGSSSACAQCVRSAVCACLGLLWTPRRCHPWEGSNKVMMDQHPVLIVGIVGNSWYYYNQLLDTRLTRLFWSDLSELHLNTTSNYSNQSRL